MQSTNSIFKHDTEPHHIQQSLYTIPAAWVVAIAPHFYAASLGGKTFDNRSPRTYTASLKDTQTLDAATKQRIIRAEGAQQNGFENVGLFAAAVVAANSTFSLSPPALELGR